MTLFENKSCQNRDKGFLCLLITCVDLRNGWLAWKGLEEGLYHVLDEREWFAYLEMDMSIECTVLIMMSKASGP